MTKKKLVSVAAGAAGGATLGDVAYSMVLPKVGPMIPTVVAKPAMFVLPWIFRVGGAALGIVGANKLVK